MLQVAPTTVPTSLLAERQEKHTEDSGCGLILHQEEHGVCFFSLQATVALLWIRSDGLERLQELSANIYTAARSDSSNLSGMLWQFLAATMRTAGHATTGDFKVETRSLKKKKKYRDCIIFYRIGSKHLEDKVLTVSWRFFTLLQLLVQSDATIFSRYTGSATFRWTEASVRVISGADWASQSVTPLDLYLSSMVKQKKNI